MESEVLLLSLSMMTFYLSPNIKIMALVLTFAIVVWDEEDFSGSHWSRKGPPQGVFFPSLSHNMSG